MNPKRGEIWIAELGAYNGCEQGGARPVLIIQNDVGNYHSPTVIVASITSGTKKYIPTHVHIKPYGNMYKDSVILLEQIRTIDKMKIVKYVAKLPADVMQEVNTKILMSLGMTM